MAAMVVDVIKTVGTIITGVSESERGTCLATVVPARLLIGSAGRFAVVNPFGNTDASLDVVVGRHLVTSVHYRH